MEADSMKAMLGSLDVLYSVLIHKVNQKMCALQAKPNKNVKLKSFMKDMWPAPCIFALKFHLSMSPVTTWDRLQLKEKLQFPQSHWTK